MRPFRSRVLAALVMAILFLGLLGTIARADDTPIANVTAVPTPVVTVGGSTTVFPEDPWSNPALFPEDPWPGF